ncbi:permease-like cell division protein FtsX [Actinomadura madurae]|uniref:permease-like cell division protein FtsX n=1 Tax=Actinomadura madurae TaxID=1993 RepID=UPI0020265968|nr:permease-like cell division protein FtsX [Actinomadura madurae]MCP9950481.1 permease-like cell division protein FtsX [Actinomadura madurae]MCP9967263.1 permease-like cell division protein FtsX [Actinomadura madurae]MCP9979719.1 permease-like cell division protein FtsX [Actinomadura madurae]MCQ0008749.1 permease-like cell division protein FtsX [Actinomadura madurae]MCQ0015931.1 permease-like cell division protein FtsX [Actinomadura madurae]
MRVQFVLQEIWIGLRRNMTMTISLVITVAIAMALFGTGLLLREQVRASKSYWYDKIEVSIFLCAKTSSNPVCQKQDVSDQQRQTLKAQLEKMPQVSNVQYETKQQAYERFKDRFSGSPGFVESTREGDIPDSFRVKLKNPEEYKAVAQAMLNQPGVDSVINEQEILKRFFRILNGLQLAALTIALIQVVAAVMLVGNTVRLSAFNRRRETGIMRLVGASNTYIQMPFILEGAIAGLIGGLFASVLLVFSKKLLVDRLAGDVQLVSQLGWSTVVLVIIVSICFGVLLCAVSSFLTLRRYLRI